MKFFSAASNVILKQNSGLAGQGLLASMIALIIVNILAFFGHTFVVVLVLRIGTGNWSICPDPIGPVLLTGGVIVTHFRSVQPGESIITTLSWSFWSLHAAVFVGDLHSLELLSIHIRGGSWDGFKMLPGLILGGSLAMNALSKALPSIGEYWLILISKNEDSSRMSIACWIPTLLLLALRFSSIKHWTIPSCQQTMMLSLFGVGFVMGIEFLLSWELMMKVGGRDIDWLGGFGWGLGQAPLGPN